MKLFTPLLVLFLSIPFSVFANDGDSGLGEITSRGDLPSAWKFVVGTKDSFLLSQNGRFTISSIEGGLRVTDLWKEQAITFNEMVDRFDQYPIVEIASNAKLKPFVLNKNNKEVGHSLFLIVGDSVSQEFFKEAENSLDHLGVNIYAVPGKDLDLFYSYSCGSEEWKRDILKGVPLSSSNDKCSESVLHRMGTSALAMINLLNIKRAPFFIKHSTDEGKIVNYSVFMEMKGE